MIVHATSGATPLTGPALHALARLEHGHVFDLGMAIDERMPQWPPDGAARFSRRWVTAPASVDEPGVRFAVEAVESSLHTSTHIDALVHAQSPQTIAGGARTDDVVGEGFFTTLGVDTIPPIVAPSRCSTSPQRSASTCCRATTRSRRPSSPRPGP